MMMNMMGYGGMMGSGGMMDYGYGFGFYGFLYSLLLVGVVILVYLWVFKLWREVFGGSKKK